jgi:hypothetical protein
LVVLALLVPGGFNSVSGLAVFRVSGCKVLANQSLNRTVCGSPRLAVISFSAKPGQTRPNPANRKLPVSSNVRRQNMLRITSLNPLMIALALSGCAATTTVRISPSPQEPVCASATSAKVLWTAEWRKDQKDVRERELAVADGIDQFFNSADCFKKTSIQHLPSDASKSKIATYTSGAKEFDKIILIKIRELGPVVKLGASLALVEGGTEVIFDTSVYEAMGAPTRKFSTEWRSGGPGVVKGVGSLPQDLQAALSAAFQPSSN